MSELKIKGITIVETFAEAFPMVGTRIIITAPSLEWALTAARTAASRGPIIRLKNPGGFSPCAVALLVLMTSPGFSAPDVQRDDPAATYLQRHPGGIRLNDNEVQYGPIIVTVVQPAAANAPHCPGGWFCFYEGPNFTFPQGRLSECGWQDLTIYRWGNRVASAYYNLGNGRGFTVREVLQAVEAATGRAVPVKEGSRRPGDPPRLLASAARIRKELGFEPRLASLDVIVETALRWRVDHPRGYAA